MTDKLQTLHAEQGTDGTWHWSHQSHDHLHMLELVAMLSLEVNENEQAPLGQRIRAVGTCFYNKGDLKKGNNYQLRRNRDNPKDTNCFEVRSRHITMATMNMNFSRLPYYQQSWDNCRLLLLKFNNV